MCLPKLGSLKNKMGQANSISKPCKMDLYRQFYKDKRVTNFIPLYIHFSEDCLMGQGGIPFQRAAGRRYNTHRSSVAPTTLQQPCLHQCHRSLQGSFSALYWKSEGLA